MRKIAVYVPNAQGGVRNVTENLSKGLEILGFEVVRCPNVFALLRARFRFGAEKAILSLATGLAAPFFANSIYVLHGFAVRDAHGPIDRLAIPFVARWARYWRSRLVAVSYLTRAVYERIYGVSVDAVVFNGVSPEFFSERQYVPKQKRVLFVGRLIDGKKVRQTVDAFFLAEMDRKGYELMIIGNGPLLSELQSLARRQASLKVLGEVSEDKKVTLLREAEIFITLNDFEPMGVVTAEALVCQCKIVAAHCGGHREFIPNGYPFFPCDPSRPSDIGSALIRAAAANEPDPSLEWSHFDYDKTVCAAYSALLG